MAHPPRTPEKAIKGRGATFNPGNRFAHHEREDYDDGWQPLAPDRLDADAGEELPPSLKTTVTVLIIRSIISRNDSPDIGFTQSINPYQGCEHGCIYCYARPSHAYLDLSPGLDFESKLFAKPDAPEQLRRELMHPRYQPETIVIGTNTDCYQPIEREWKITRGLLEVMPSQARKRQAGISVLSLQSRTKSIPARRDGYRAGPSGPLDLPKFFF